jgi:transcriptional regulator with XRE-family HTH domain
MHKPRTLIRTYRALAGLTQYELGELIGRDPSWVSAVENGYREPRLRDVVLISGVLGIPEKLLEFIIPSTPIGARRLSRAEIASEPALARLVSSLPTANAVTVTVLPGSVIVSTRPSDTASLNDLYDAALAAWRFVPTRTGDDRHN